MRRCGVMCFHGAVAALVLLAAGGAAAPLSTPSACPGRAALLVPGAGLHRLRGGFEAVMPFRPANLGQPNAWSGKNIGPKEKHMKYLHAKARPAVKVQSRWYIDCTRPVGDKLIDINDLERYLRENIKVQGKTGNLAAGKLADQPRVIVFVEKSARVIMQSYIPVAKRYVKYLIKNYLHKRGLRDFVWCVAAGKASYALKYYNIEDIKSAAAAPAHDAAAAAAAAEEAGETAVGDEEAAVGDEEAAVGDEDAPAVVKATVLEESVPVEKAAVGDEEAAVVVEQSPAVVEVTVPKESVPVEEAAAAVV